MLTQKVMGRHLLDNIAKIERSFEIIRKEKFDESYKKSYGQKSLHNWKQKD
jgi:hypothetical protein